MPYESGIELAPTPGLEVLDHHPHLQHPYNSTERLNTAPWGSASKNQSPYPPIPEKPRANRFSGIAIWVAATAVIVGGAVGGGLGGALANSATQLSNCQTSLSTCQGPQAVTQSESPSPTTNLLDNTATSSMPIQTTTKGLYVNYEPQPHSKVSTINVDCKTLNDSVQTTHKGDKFHVYCGVDFGSGKRKNGSGKDIVLADLVGIFAYSVADCLQACSQYNFQAKVRKDSGRCGAITLDIDMANKTDGNCWLKNSTLTHTPGGGACKECVSATEIS
ncbi:hypothetical protein F4861DRAFT_424021 [Xylaria intraflava]|nr:hypothetical protein F4861DRAFT_424021 [Xylaria intraflava]